VNTTYPASAAFALEALLVAWGIQLTGGAKLSATSSTGTQLLKADACKHRNREGVHEKQAQSQQRRVHEREHMSEVWERDTDKAKRYYPI